MAILETHLKTDTRGHVPEWVEVHDVSTHFSITLNAFVGKVLRVSPSTCGLLFLFSFSFLSSKKSTWRPWASRSVFAQRLRCGGSEFALILAMLLSAHALGRPWYAWWCARQQPWHRRRIIHTLMNSLLPPNSLPPPPSFTITIVLVVLPRFCCDNCTSSDHTALIDNSFVLR